MMQKIELNIPSSLHSKLITFDIFLPENYENKPIVLFAHGFKGYKDWGPFSLMMQKIAQNDLITVNMNFSHNGTTPEQLIDFPDLEAFGNNTFSKELHDVKDVIDFLEAKYNTSQLFLMGHSRGGATMLIKSFEDERVKGTITLGSVITIKDKYADNDWQEWKKEGVKYIYNGRTLQNMPLYKDLAEDIFENKNRFDILNFAPKIAKPTLLIHGTNDQVIALEESLLLKNINPNIEHFIIENANHTFGGKHPLDENTLPIDLNKAVEKSVNFVKQHINHS